VLSFFDRVVADLATREWLSIRDQSGHLDVVVAGPPTMPLPMEEGSRVGAGGDGQVGWDLLVPRLVHPTKVIILESMLWIERPLSATELEQISARDPDLRTFSYHLKHLEELGVLEVAEKRKARRSRSSKKETFFYFTGHR
jgi:hypothetical protein